MDKQTKEVKSCKECIHFHSSPVTQGRYPLMRNDCKHPNAEQVDGFLMHGNLKATAETPFWCPLELERRDNEEIITHIDCL